MSLPIGFMMPPVLSRTLHEGIDFGNSSTGAYQLSAPQGSINNFRLLATFK